jgi:hypothetical protein
LNQSRSWVPAFVVVLFLLLLAGLVWADYRFAQSGVAGEGFSIQYLGIQSLVKAGSDPYGDQVTAQIQQSVAMENAFIIDNYPRFTSPLYSGLVIFPIALIGDRVVAHALWLTAQFVLIFGILLLCLRMTSWKPSWYNFFLFTLCLVFSYHVVVPWLDGGLSIWAAFFLVITLVAIGANRNEVGGVFLALAMVQPQMVILPVAFTIIWCISTKRGVLVVWFFVTLILLSVISLFIVPDWIIQYIRLLYNFSRNFPPGTPGLFFSINFPGLGRQLGWLVSGLAMIILAVEWLLSLRKDFRWFLWTVCLTIVLSQWVGIPVIPMNFIQLIIPFILISAMLTERWQRGGPWSAVMIAAVLFVWQWGIYYLDLHSSQPAMQLNLIFPLPAILLIGLYWVRWWAIKPRRLLIEELRLSETY